MANILVIKLGALGDVLYATTAFRSLRNYHSNDCLSILTTKPYEDLINQTGFFDQVILDDKPKIYELKKLLEKRRFFANFQKIYDLQMVDRTKFYYYLSRDKNKWVKYGGPNPNHIHPLERFHHQFQKLSIPYNIKMDLNYLAKPLPINLPDNFVILVPGASMAHGGKKRWNEENFALLAQYLWDMKISPVIIGLQANEFSKIKDACPQAMDLSGLTSIYQLIYLGTQASLAIGNDTGPMIAINNGGCPTLTLYSGVTKTHLGGPRAKNCYSIQVDDLKDLEVSKVLHMAKSILMPTIDKYK